MLEYVALVMLYLNAAWFFFTVWSERRYKIQLPRSRDIAAACILLGGCVFITEANKSPDYALLLFAGLGANVYVIVLHHLMDRIEPPKEEQQLDGQQYEYQERINPIPGISEKYYLYWFGSGLVVYMLALLYWISELFSNEPPQDYLGTIIGLGVGGLIPIVVGVRFSLLRVTQLIEWDAFVANSVITQGKIIDHYEYDTKYSDGGELGFQFNVGENTLTLRAELNSTDFNKFALDEEVTIMYDRKSPQRAVIRYLDGWV